MSRKEKPFMDESEKGKSLHLVHEIMGKKRKFQEQVHKSQGYTHNPKYENNLYQL